MLNFFDLLVKIWTMENGDFEFFAKKRKIVVQSYPTLAMKKHKKSEQMVHKQYLYMHEKQGNYRANIVKLRFVWE